MQDASGRRLDGRSTAQRHRGRLGIVIAIGIGILLSELVAGFATGSLALVADAAHVFADVAGSTLTLAAIWLGGRPATSRRTFGFYRMEILATVLNAVLLFAIAALVLVEAARRLDSRPQVASGPVLIVAAIALVANLAAARLLVTPQRESLALRTTYLEVLGDALGSCAVLAAALIMVFTGAFAADALASAFIGLLILIRTWGLLREAVDVLLEATPRDVDLDLVLAPPRSPRRARGPRPPRVDPDQRPERRVGTRAHRRGRQICRRAGWLVPMPGDAVRHRALDVPARDEGPSGDRAGGSRLAHFSVSRYRTRSSKSSWVIPRVRPRGIVSG